MSTPEDRVRGELDILETSIIALEETCDELRVALEKLEQLADRARRLRELGVTGAEVWLHDRLNPILTEAVEVLAKENENLKKRP